MVGLSRLEKKFNREPAWASCEGANLLFPAAHSGITMETYLDRCFNHGATLVNIFGWGIGAGILDSVPVRIAAEGAEALTAYRKFLAQ